MVFYSVGSAVGAIAATTLYAAAGWGAVCVLGAAFSCAGFALWAFTRHGAPASAAAPGSTAAPDPAADSAG